MHGILEEKGTCTQVALTLGWGLCHHGGPQLLQVPSEFVTCRRGQLADPEQDRVGKIDGE